MSSRYASLLRDISEPIQFDQILQDTSIKQVSAAIRYLLKNNLVGPYTVNLDLGGGKWELGSQAIAEAGGFNLIVDPYAKSYIYNQGSLLVLSEVYPDGVDTVTLSSVLNVIPDWKIRERVVAQAYAALKIGGCLVAVIHEGDRSGVGKVTQINTYQANLGTKYYLNIFEEIFGSKNVTRNGNKIICHKK